MKKKKSIKHLFIESVSHFSSHNAPRMGAALSYYAIFSLVPLLTLIITLSALFFEKEIVESAISRELVDFLGNNTAQYITDLLNQININNVGLRATIVSVATLIVATLGAFSELDKDLDELWKCTSKKVKQKMSFFNKIKKIIKEKILILSIVPLLSLMLVISASSTLLLGFINSKFSDFYLLTQLLPLIQVIISFILNSAVFILIYKIFPNLKFKWSILLMGAVFTSTLFIIGNLLISLYLNYVTNLSAYGAASTLMGILIWVYYSSQAFFLGASFTYIYGKSVENATVFHD